MTIVALLVIPLFGALAVGLVRPPWPRWLALVALLAMDAILVVGLLRGNASGPVQSYSVLGTPLALTSTGSVGLVVATFVVLVAIAATIGDAREREIASVGLFSLSGVALATLAGAGLVTVAVALVIVGCAFTVALVPDPATSVVRQTGRRFLIWLALASSALLFSSVLDRLYVRQPGPGLLGPVAALFVVGIGITAAALPFSLWLPALCAESPSGAALAVGLLAGATAAILSGVLGATPWLLTEPSARLGLGVVGAAAGCASAFLALGEKDPARCFAYLISANADFILAGLAVSPPGEVRGAIWAFLAQAVAAALGLACLGGDRRQLVGLFWRRPALAIGEAVAAASLIGLPLTAGFVGRSAIAAAAGSQHLVPLLVTAVAMMLGGAAALRCFGIAFARVEGAPERPRLLDAVALLLTITLFVGGLDPGPILALLG